MSPQEIAKLPQTYYMGNGRWGHKCPCGARETGEPHGWHDKDCPRYLDARHDWQVCGEVQICNRCGEGR